MELSLQTMAGAATFAPSNATGGTTATASPAMGTTAASPGITATAVAPQDTGAVFAALTARSRLGDDTSQIAISLRQTMQGILAQRPDLANATFDFVSRNGVLQVVATNLTTADQTWLSARLNANTALVASVAAFNADVATVYFTTGDAGSPTATAAGSNTSDQADGVKFMTLLATLGSDMQDTLNDSGGTYSRTDGGPLDLAQPPNSAASFLSYFDQMRAVENDALILTIHGKSDSHTFKVQNAYYAASYTPLPGLEADSAAAPSRLSVKA